MSSAERYGLQAGLVAQHRSLIQRHFEQDVEFYQLVLLLINQSCPIKRVDLVWADDGPAVRVGLAQKTVCTEAALASRCAHLINPADSEPHFCNLVNGNGEHQAESCGISDRAAEQRVRRTRKPDAYRCHAGLIDIAVPVICEGQHIATLFTGQVLTEPKSEEQFIQIRDSLSRLSYLDSSKLEAAYWNVPQVSQQDIQRTTEVLEILARHLANTWKRLIDLVRDQRQRDREARLCRKELAHMLLDGKIPTAESMREFLRRVGFTGYPNRAMAVTPEAEESYGQFGLPFQLAFGQTLDAIEQLCDSLPDVCCAYLHGRGFCVFFRDQEDSDELYGLRARSLAEKILAAVSQASGMRARIGIGSLKPSWQSLGDSFQEACIALSETTEPITVYRKVPASSGRLPADIAILCGLVRDRKIADARRALAPLALAVNRECSGAPDPLAARRHWFSFVMTKMTSVACSFGISPPDPAELGRELAGARTMMALQDSFVSAGERILQWIESLYAGQHERLIGLARAQIEHALQRSSTAQTISVNTIANSLGISPAYLTRLLKRSTGMTFERYVMKARVDAAEALFLDPLLTVSTVAERCGFTDTAYFSRVFRKVTGGTPTDYRKNPLRFLTKTDEASTMAGRPGPVYFAARPDSR